MGKFCLPAIPQRYVRGVTASAILALSLAGLRAQAASHEASAVLHIQVVVVPTVQMTTAQPSTTVAAGSISYNLQPSTPRMSSQVTVQPISKSGPTGSWTDGPSGKSAVLKTTTIVPE
jgi:hypothetical protein